MAIEFRGRFARTWKQTWSRLAAFRTSRFILRKANERFATATLPRRTDGGKRSHETADAGVMHSRSLRHGHDEFEL